MYSIILALCSGFIFGLGLVIGQMTNPEVVIGFLDVFGNWNPNLLLLMCSALTTTFIGFYFVLKRKKPFLATQFYLPLKKQIDRPLIIGGILFGIGWGLSGYCPAPAIVGLSINSTETVTFLLAMILGMNLYRFSSQEK